MAGEKTDSQVTIKAVEPITTPNAYPSNGSKISPMTSSGEISSQSRSNKFAISAAGIALISDGYFNNIMTMINVILKEQYPKEYTSATRTRISNALLAGAIFGQIIIGITCDYCGRKFAVITTTLLIIFGGALATGSAGITVNGMFWMMTVARFIIGFGVGGEYPASSTSASEAANEHSLKHRGQYFILATNLPLAFGGPLAISIFIIVLAIAGFHREHYNKVWRVCFGIGCIFPLAIFYFRIKTLNSTLYRRGSIKKNVPYLLVLKFYWAKLIGTCGAWFLYDFVTFPNGVFSGTIIASVISPEKDDIVLAAAEWNLLLGVIALPGVMVGAYVCDWLGRKNTMMIGFCGYLIFGLTIGCSYHKITEILPLFIVFYGLMQSFGNLGPGNMLGLISSESYATSVRGTCYGISAAVGKVGAVAGTAAFTPIQKNLGDQWTFIIAAICGVMGILVTSFFVADITNEDLSIVDGRFERYLRANKWNGQMGEEGLELPERGGAPEVKAGESERG